MSSASPSEIARRVMRELRALSGFENSDFVTTERDRKDLARIRRLCTNLCLANQGRHVT